MAHKSKVSSARELRALLWLLPVLAVASWLVWEISRPKTGMSVSAELPTDSVISRQRGADLAARNDVDCSYSGADFAPTEVRGGRDSTDSTALPTERGGAKGAPLSLQYFDPNTVTYHDLVRLGFTRGEALGIVKYRERGKVFEIPEDFAACYQVSEEMYRRLEPYIRIGEKYRLKPFERSGSSTERRPSPLAGEVSREGDKSTVSNAESVREITVAHPDHGSRPILVDLNTADSAALIAVSGIGPRTVVRIMEYRRRLGGFAAVEQLAEIRGVTEQNYERIIEQIYVDPAVIQKIDVNFAPAKTLAAHPYIRAEALRKLLKHRQLKGGWRTPEELENDDIFTAEELAKLGPYLIFN